MYCWAYLKSIQLTGAYLQWLAVYSTVHTVGTVHTAWSGVGLVEESSLLQSSEPMIDNWLRVKSLQCLCNYSIFHTAFARDFLQLRYRVK